MGCFIIYAYGEMVGAKMVEAFGTTLVCTTVPIAYTRLVVGAERLAMRSVHAVGLALFSMWLFAAQSDHPWDAFFAVGCAHIASLALGGSMVSAGALSAAAALLAAVTLHGGALGLPPLALRVAAAAACAVAAVAAAAPYVLPVIPRIDAKRAAVLVAAAAAAAGAAPAVTSHFLPVREFGAAYGLAARLGGPALHARAAQLALVTVHVQLPLGYAGVSYLRVAQARCSCTLRPSRPHLLPASSSTACLTTVVLSPPAAWPPPAAPGTLRLHLAADARTWHPPLARGARRARTDCLRWAAAA